MASRIESTEMLYVPRNQRLKQLKSLEHHISYRHDSR